MAADDERQAPHRREAKRPHRPTDRFVPPGVPADADPLTLPFLPETVDLDDLEPAQKFWVSDYSDALEKLWAERKRKAADAADDRAERADPEPP